MGSQCSTASDYFSGFFRECKLTGSLAPWRVVFLNVVPTDTAGKSSIPERLACSSANSRSEGDALKTWRKMSCRRSWEHNRGHPASHALVRPNCTMCIVAGIPLVVKRTSRFKRWIRGRLRDSVGDVAAEGIGSSTVCIQQ